MKKIYSCLAVSLSLCYTALTSFAAPAEEAPVMVSQLEAADFITVSGLAFFLLGLLFVLLSVYAGLKKKNKIDEDFDDIEFAEDTPKITEQPEVEDVEDDNEDTAFEADKETDEETAEPAEEVSADTDTEADETEAEPVIESEPEPEEIIEEPKIRITLTGTNNPDVRFAEFCDRCTLGRRNTNDIMISDNAVSGNHCEFIAEEDKIIIRDLNSTNGTLLNGELITAEEIKTGDLIVVGKLQYRISIMR